MGRAMTNNIINLGIENEVRDALTSLGYTYEELSEVEPDAGLGNGGLGRLASCSSTRWLPLRFQPMDMGFVTTTESSVNKSKTDGKQNNQTTGCVMAIRGKSIDRTLSILSSLEEMSKSSGNMDAIVSSGAVQKLSTV